MIMKSIVLPVLIAAMLFSCTKNGEIPQNQLTKQEIEEGWQLLFDGETLNGWRGLGRDTLETNSWKVENGFIHKIDSRLIPPLPDGKKIDGGDLITIDTFENFELYFEWKIKKDGNSGIKYNVSEKLTNGWGSRFAALGFEYQILDDSSKLYKDLKPHQLSGALYEIITPKNVHLHPVGEINNGRILVNGNHGEHWLNGIKVLEFELATAEFDSLYQLSKFAKYPGFQQKRSGHIVITNHIDESWYRNIKIRTISN
jgi:hypothetical protein